MAKFRFRRLNELWQDEHGFALVMFAFALVPLLGLVGLIVDLKRYETLNTELQDIADASALAGALQLDGTSDAITRATNAAVNFVATDPKFASGSLATQVTSNPTYYSDANCSTTTTNAPKAVCISVTTQVRSMSLTFASLIPGLANTMQTQATATAQSQYVACKVQPLMLCTPFASTNLDSNLTRGQMLQLKAANGSQNIVPGAFGLLDPPGYTQGGGSTMVATNLGSSSLGFCYINKLSVRTGNVVSAVTDGIDIRFDIPPNGNSELSSLSPAPNVIKGNASNQCWKSNNLPKTWPPPGALPRDSCLTAGNCPASTSNLSIGNGDWSASAPAYWTAHHSGQPMPANLGKPGGLTRYDLWNLETGCTATSCTGTPASGYAFSGTSPEKAAPTCSSVTPGGPERRIVYAAVADCTTQVTGGGTQATLAGSAVAKFFLTEPTPDGTIYAEYLGMVPNTSSEIAVHHIVQLVR